MRRPISPKPTVIDSLRAHPGGASGGQAGGFRAIRQHQRDVGRKRRIAGGGNQRRHVGPAATDQDRSAAFHVSQLAGGSNRTVATPWRVRLSALYTPFPSISPIRLTISP